MPSENTVHIAIELSFSSWLVAARLTGAKKSRLHRIEGGDTGALLALIAELRSRELDWLAMRRLSKGSRRTQRPQEPTEPAAVLEEPRAARAAVLEEQR